MKTLKWIYCSFLLMGLSTGVFALEEDKAARLEALMELEMEQLGEVDVKLDDVFDVFEGLVKPQNVTIASGIQQSTATAPSSTTVITAQDIEAMGARSLEEILDAVPGMHIGLSETRFAPLFEVRGMHSASNYEILMMINGLPIKSILNGSRGAWSPPPVQFIRRIEIIRGPGSALYGADAVSGVINIITKTADDIQGSEVGLRAGSFQTYNPWLLHGEKINDFDISLSVNYLDTDGHQETIHQDAQSLLDKVTRTNVSQAPGRPYLQKRQLNLHSTISKGFWQLGLNWSRDRNMGAGLGSSLIISPEEHHETDQFLIRALYQRPKLTEHWDFDAQLSFQDAQENWFNTYSARPNSIRNGEVLPYGAPNNVGYYQRQTRLDLNGQFRGFQNHNIRVGTGYLYADLHSVPWSYLMDRNNPVQVDVRALGQVLIPENIRQNRYLFVQDTWKLSSHWELTTGIRHDWYSDFNATANPRAALVWLIDSNLTAKFLYGSAFRAPSFVEMYTPKNRALVGNPNLKAETNKTFEIGLDYRANNSLNFALNLFSYEVKDKIQRRLLDDKASTSGRIYTYDNIGTLKGQGFEVESRWKINNKSSLLFNYSYAKLKTNLSEEAGDYPHHKVYLRHDWLFGRSWFLDTRLNWIVDRDRPLENSNPPLKDYLQMDMTLRYKDVSNKTPWNIAIGVRNLLDQDIREAGDPRLMGDYPKAGREWFSEIRYKF
jgi:outer membrane receptor for ferrienterochelin and colicin